MLKSFLALFISAQLLSPLWTGEPDYSSKISKNIPQTPKLNYELSKPVSSLKNLKSYIVYDADTGAVYASSNTTDRISPASFTKLLSSQIVSDLLPLDYVITAQKQWLNQEPTILGILPGEQFSLSELLRASIATSGNDAAVTMSFGTANFLGLKPESFMDLMNKKAELIGMSQSHFMNPNGFDDPNQYTTIEDLTKLVYASLKNYPSIVDAAKSDNQDIKKTDRHGHYYLPNWNGLLGVYPNITGLKIAYTENAGYSTIVSYSKDDTNLVAIVSGADSLIERDRAAASLLDAALIANKQKPVNISAEKIKRRYAEWNKLSAKIKAELKAQGLL